MEVRRREECDLKQELSGHHAIVYSIALGFIPFEVLEMEA
jgi:hypothetical protein